MNNATDVPTLLQVLPAMRSGGVERGTVEIADAVVKKGWRALVASEGGPMVNQLLYKKAEPITLPLASKNPLQIWLNSRKLIHLIRERSVNIIHARSRAPAWSAYLAARATGIPLVTTFHGTYNREGFAKEWYNSVMTRGDRVIAVSDFIREHVLTHYEIEESKLTRIHRGADLNQFSPATVQAGAMMELSERWGLEENTLPIILMPGRITRWKGHETFIEALATLPNRSWIAVILGDDTGHEAYRESLQARIAALGLSDNVRFAANTPHMPEAYALSHCVVCASSEPEAFGRVPVEAQAMGKPIIATDHGGASETVRHDETGFLVQPEDAEGMGLAIAKSLAMDESTLARFKRTAMQHVSDDFSTAKMQDATLQLYESLLTR